jgi:DNA processing protein
VVFEITNSVSPFEEMVAYETLWANLRDDLLNIADKFQLYPNRLPSQVLEILRSQNGILYSKLEDEVRGYLKTKKGFSVSVHGTYQYPTKLRSAKHPIELFYYKGNINLLEGKSISIVGARKCSEEGAKRARRLSKGLVQNGFTIVSGLARGIDTAAMTAAIEAGGQTVGVIGTPIDQYYPPENRELQNTVATKHLLISHVPFYRYSIEPFNSKRRYFVQRNLVMAALSDATVIVEASDTSGSLTQAQACFAQNKPLFILKSCLDNPNISWPAQFIEKGARLLTDFPDILAALS